MAIYKLEEIASLKSGSTPSRKIEKYWKNPNLKWLTSGEVKFNVKETKEKINFEEYRKKPFKINSPIMAMYGVTAGKVGLLGEKMYVNQAICVFSVYKKYVLEKYLYYVLEKESFKISRLSIGGAQQNLSLSTLSKYEVEIPKLNIQQKIIDIIEQNEELFLRHSNCVRINNLQNVKKDMKSLIDIIEPLEVLENNILNLKQNIIFLLINIYIFFVSNNKVSFRSLIKLQNHKYENQSKYFATNAIGELTIDYTKIINLTKNIPSRANVIPDNDSFILSKLDGENKIFYFKQKPTEVFSTGFFNFKTNYQDFILGFLLSQEFKIQKNEFSTGTTMRGINNATLEKISLNEPKFESKFFSELLFDLEKMRIRLIGLKDNLIRLLIK